MAAPTTPTLAITQGGDPVTAGETITRGAVLLISLTGSTIPSASAPPSIDLTWSDADSAASPPPTIDLTWSDA